MTLSDFFGDNRIPRRGLPPKTSKNYGLDYAHATVRDEDYRLVQGLQANLESGARDHLLFGRNEPGLQHRHMSWASWHPAASSSAVVR
jgi:hypothetical protein